jgi:hypothetical protein
MLLAISGAASSGAASAEPAKRITVRAKASIQEHDVCSPANSIGALVGTAKFRRTGERITLKVVLKGALPNKQYRVTLMHAIENGCSSGKFNQLWTNKKGNGHTTLVEYRPRDETQFAALATAAESGEPDGTPYVSLP